jgi:hypothetical protein
MSSDEMLAKKDEFFGHNVVRDPYPKLAERAAECPVHPGTFSSFFDMVGAEDILFPDAEQISVLSFDGVDAGFKDQEHFSSCWYGPKLLLQLETVARRPKERTHALTR